jgi:large subunit ribosomal protein L15
MVVRKEAKRRRGERSYHGSHKKWRGAGSRGGHGNAGMHKHKWSYTLKYEPDHFGKRGFRPIVTKEIRTINLKDLDQLTDKLLEKKLAEKEGDKIKIDLGKIGYDKLLGSGRATKPLVVEAKYFSKQAIKKLEDASGKAVVKDTVKGAAKG